jgi:hypothetical protein
MKPRHVVLGAALALAAGLVLFGDNSAQVEVAEAIERPAQATGPAPRAAPDTDAVALASEPAVLRLLPREALIGDSADRFDTGENDLFAQQDWTPPPPPPEPAPPPPPPVAPPLPFTYIGKSLEEGNWEIYLARGDRTYLVRDKAVIDGTWRVDSIKPPILTLTYLPLNQVQQLNIGVFD